MLKSKITRHYEKHDCQRISQGDILRDLNFVVIMEKGKQVEIKFPYVVILSQDCDLEQGIKYIEIGQKGEEGTKVFNQFLHNVLFVPAFPAETLRKGEHLLEVFKIKTEHLNTDRLKVIKKNNNPRYHYLNPCTDSQVPELLIDFKAYYTLPIECIMVEYTACYLATTNELFREELSQRFAYYLSRIGTPELEETAITP